MQKLVELTISAGNLEQEVGPPLHNQVFHFTSGSKFKKIQNFQSIIPNSGTPSNSSIHSDESVGKHLNAVCLFDLRNKTSEQIAPGKSYYDYLEPRFGDSLVFLILSKGIYHRITTLDQLDKTTLETKMYLPEIESWHKGPISIKDLDKILVINVTK